VDETVHYLDLSGHPVVDLQSFISRYNVLTKIFDECAGETFGHVNPYRNNIYCPVTSPTIQHILSQIRTTKGAIRLATNPEGDVSMNSIRTYNKLLHEFYRNPEEFLDIRSYLIHIRKRLYKELYKECMLVVSAHTTEANCKKISDALLGGSTRRLVSTAEYIGLPTAVNSLDGTGEVITEPEKCKKIMRNYFQGLYHHNELLILPKPWMDSPSVAGIKDAVTKDPFIWPKLANVDDFRTMIRRGNHRPAPSSDSWEKWLIKNLSDYALGLVLDLHNFIIISSDFPGNVKDM
jgi:hypothetical protein